MVVLCQAGLVIALAIAPTGFGRLPGIVQAAPLFAPVPSAAVSAGNVSLGGDFTITATFSNAIGDAAGYGPFIDLYIPHTGLDGVFPGNSLPALPPLPPPAFADAYDGISPVAPATGYSATYLGNSLTVHTLNFGDDGGGFGCVEHPLAIDAAGMFVDVCGKAGDQLVTIVLPFGSFTPGQPPVSVEVPASLSPYADLDDLVIRARGGFQYGATPTNDWCCPAPPNPPDTTILSDANPDATAWVAHGTVTPTLFSLTKGGGAETATGPNYWQTYNITVDIADGQTLSGIVITDELPDNIVYLGPVTVSGGGVVVTEPVAGTPHNPPDNQLVVQYASATGGPGSNDISISFPYYIAEFDANAAPVIPPLTGTPSASVNTASMSGSWSPQDRRDSDKPVNGVGVSSGANLPLDASKGSSIAPTDDSGSSGATPGDIVTYTVAFDISDYFAVDGLVASDVFSDGQRFYSDPTHLPQVRVTRDGLTTTHAFDPANLVVSCNYTGAVIGPDCDLLDPAADNGETSLTFYISQQLLDDGANGQFLGGLVPDGGAANDGITTASITFYTQIQDRYSDLYAGANLKQRDALSDFASVTGLLLDVSTCGLGACTTYPGNPTVSDSDSANVVIVNGGLAKSIYAVNGVACAIQPCPDVHVAPGDSVTYRIVSHLMIGDFKDLTITDYLPLPIFKADDPDADGVALVPAEGNWSKDTVNAVPDTGKWRLGPADTLAIDPALTVSGSAANNSIVFDFGAHDDPGNTEQWIDLLFSLTVTRDPYADGLQMTNQVEQRDYNSPSVVAISTEINQLTLTEPVLVGEKSAVSTTHAGVNPNPAIPAPIVFDLPGLVPDLDEPWTGGNIHSTYLGADNGALNSGISGVDGGDLVKFAIVIQNTGSGLDGAFDITIKDLLPGGYIIPNFGSENINLQIYRGDGAALNYINVGAGSLLGDGIQIVDPPLGDPEYGYGACQAHDATSGKNVIIITYDLMVDPNISAGQLIANNQYLRQLLVWNRLRNRVNSAQTGDLLKDLG